MSNNILSTGFRTGPDESTAVGDVYKSNLDNETINKAGTSKARKAFSKILDQAKDDSGGLKEAIKTFKGGADGVEIDQEKVSDRITGVLGGQKKLGMDLGADFLSDLTNDLLNSKDDKGISIDIGETVTYLKNADFESAKGLTDVLNTLTDNEDVIKLTNNSTILGVFGKIIDVAIDLGIPSAIDRILDEIEDAKEKERLLITKLGRAIRASDIALINKIIDINGAARCLAEEPEAINNIIRFYRMDREVRRNQYASKLTQLVAVLNRLNSKWDVYTRDGEEIPNLVPFVYGSSDSKKLFALSSDYRLLSIMAPNYRKKDLLGMLSSQYEYLVLPMA